MGKLKFLQAILPLMMLSLGERSGQGRSSSNVSAEKYRNIPKGCSIFNIDGIKVMALNYKNAVRKAKAGKIWES